MAVLGFREILPRSYEHKLGDSPTAGRVFVATVDEPTNTSAVVGAIGISHGDSHPDHTTLQCDSISAEETDRHHVTVRYGYGVPDPESKDQNPEQPPWIQPDRWAFGTTNSQVACTQYYPRGLGDGNQAVPLVNTAGDGIFGQTRAEAELKITISGSRLRLDLSKIKRYVNTINKTEWCGFPKHTVQCVGVSASPARIEFQGAVLDYWDISVELLYRSTTHNLPLPNVGWNVIVDGKKQRAWTYVIDEGVREKVPTPHPVSLNSNGGFLCGPSQDGAGDWQGGTTNGDGQTGYL